MNTVVKSIFSLVRRAGLLLENSNVPDQTENTFYQHYKTESFCELKMFAIEPSVANSQLMSGTFIFDVIIHVYTCIYTYVHVHVAKAERR